MQLGIVVGFEQEAQLVASWGRVAIGGGTYAGAEKAAEVLVELGAEALISFGVAGGLDPALEPGTVLAASEVMMDGEVYRANLTPPGVRTARLAGSRVIVGSVAEKAALWEATGAATVDIESGAVARVARKHRLPFGALRAVCDPASRTLPPAAIAALDDGVIRFDRVLRSIALAPWQLPALLRLAGDARKARAALQRLRLGPINGEG